MLKKILLLIFSFFLINHRINLQGVQIFDAIPENGFNDSNMNSNGEFRFLSNYLSSTPKVIFDVGANIGEWSLCCSQLSLQSNIYAFEPTPHIFRILKLNTFNKNIACFNYAISKDNSKCTFYLYNDSFQTDFSELNSIYERAILKNQFNLSPKSIEIKTNSLDSFCFERNIDQIDFVKIDTEGNEYNILLGAKKLLTNGSIKVVQFEYGGTYLDANAYLKDCFFYLKNLHYKIYRILPNGLLEIAEWDDKLENYAYSNYIAIQKDQISLIPKSCFE